MSLPSPEKITMKRKEKKTKAKYKELITKRLNQIRDGKFKWLPRYLLRKIFALFDKPEGITVMEEDWDTLIVLDACRYDAFAKLAPHLPWDGRLEKKISKGSNTPEWLEKNFGNGIFDAIYVSGNPIVIHNSLSFNLNKHFNYVESVWWDHWNEHYGTVLAGDLTKIAMKMRKQAPYKRMIVHYLQPHHPFIGKTKLYGKANMGELWKHENIKKAWMDNLIYVIKEIKPLVETLNEKIVITADHGDSFRLMGGSHPYATYLPELIEVPWYIIDKRTEKRKIRKKIEAARKKL